jgi:hypothetical protein
VKRLRGAGGALLAAVLLGALGPGCPSRDLSVKVTDAGSNEVIVACESFRDACAPTVCHHNHFLCDQFTCKLRQACTVGAGKTAWDPTLPMAAQLILLSATDPLNVEAKGSCRLLDLRGCIPVVEGGCAPITVDSTECVGTAMGAAVKTSLGDDLTFGGFTDPTSALLALAFFQVPGASMACDTSAVVTPGVCTPENLVAAAGFAQPLGESLYDITCASCQAGELESFGRDTGPCPSDTKTSTCFAQRVHDALATAQ